MCYTFQEALLGSPVNHSQHTLRRAIWAVYSSLLPAAVYWAQTFTSALLLMYQTKALVRPFCFVMWALAKTKPHPSRSRVQQRLKPCWKVQFSSVLQNMTQSCALRSVRHQPAAGGQRADYNSISSNRCLFSHPQKPTNNSPLGFSWKEAQHSKGIEKQKSRKKKIRDLLFPKPSIMNVRKPQLELHFQETAQKSLSRVHAQDKKRDDCIGMTSKATST